MKFTQALATSAMTLTLGMTFSTLSLAAEPTSTTTAQLSPGLETAPTPVGAVAPGTNPKTGEGAGAITKKPMKPIKHKDLNKDATKAPAAPATEPSK